MEEQNQNMDELNQNQNSVVSPAANPSNPPAAPQGLGQMEPPQKLRFWKFAVWFVVIVVVALAGLWALGGYQEQKNIEAFKAWVESTEQAAEEFEARKAADTYGGATPQETLRLYIEAVERSDYELASKYFVLEKQGEQLKKFQDVSGITTEAINKYVSVLRDSSSKGGNFSSDGNYFSFDGEVLISVTRYPSGIWKIVEI